MEIVKMLASSWPWILAIVAMATIANLITTSKKSGNKSFTYNKCKSIVTDREFKFYKELKSIADKMRLTVFTKVRLSDLIEPKSTTEYRTALNKINQKHVDFVLCDSVQLKPLLVIELDDSTHNRDKNKKRDEDKNAALKSAGLQILRTYSASNLEAEINKAITPATAGRKA